MPIAIGAGIKPNRWDLVLLALLLALLAVLAHGGALMARPFDPGQPPPISLDPANLPDYLLNSAMRMATALRISLLFTLVYATLAAKVPALERVLIPLLDVLQSVPIPGYLSISVTGFIALFPGSQLGLECAAVLAIFTSQAWNMTFSLYSSLKTVPADLNEAASMLGLSPWQRFWRLELPWAIPGLVWNMMMSVSGGWFFVVASEAISVSGQTVMLPGIGSYIALSMTRGDLRAVGWAALAVLAGILIYDQLIFRPLVAWADKFRLDESPGAAPPDSWLLTLMQRARLSRALTAKAGTLWAGFADLLRYRRPPPPRRMDEEAPAAPRLPPALGRGMAGALVVGSAVAFARVLKDSGVSAGEVLEVLGLGAVTALRVVAMVALAAVIWVPIGVWVGQRRRLAQNVQWLVQFLAAVPANLIFPPVVVLILHLDLDADLWASPLMVLGTQWYILFNVIAGASAIPADLDEAAANLGLSGRTKWRRFLLPAIFPSLVTGAITAAGGCWNAAIVAEWVSWDGRRLEVTGLGAYISRWTEAGDVARVALGVAAMCLFVMAFNHLLWCRLYRVAADRLRLM